MTCDQKEVSSSQADWSSLTTMKRRRRWYGDWIMIRRRLISSRLVDSHCQDLVTSHQRRLPNATQPCQCHATNTGTSLHHYSIQHNFTPHYILPYQTMADYVHCASIDNSPQSVSKAGEINACMGNERSLRTQNSSAVDQNCFIWFDFTHF